MLVIDREEPTYQFGHVLCWADERNWGACSYIGLVWCRWDFWEVVILPATCESHQVDVFITRLGTEQLVFSYFRRLPLPAQPAVGGKDRRAQLNNWKLQP
jgi:hypothetical protein